MKIFKYLTIALLFCTPAVADNDSLLHRDIWAKPFVFKHEDMFSHRMPSHMLQYLKIDGEINCECVFPAHYYNMNITKRFVYEDVYKPIRGIYVAQYVKQNNIVQETRFKKARTRYISNPPQIEVLFRLFEWRF